MGSHGIDGARVERVLEIAGIATNKNTVPGDKSALIPGGLRIGTPALTSRGLTQEDFVKVAQFIDRGVKAAINVRQDLQTRKGKKKLKAFRTELSQFVEDFDEEKLPQDIKELRSDVRSFSQSFPTVGFDSNEMKYSN